MLQDILSRSFAKQFLQGKQFSDINIARSHASVILGSAICSGTAEAKQIDEAIETGVIQAARQIIEHAPTTKAAYQSLVELHERQPSLTMRSSESILNQAYSTPVPIAFVASHLGGVNEQTSVYEPCGGNGSLLIGASPKATTANELDPKRAEALRGQGFTVTEKDAVTYLPPQQADVVITNPPFGTVKDESGGRKKFRLAVNRDELETTRIDQAIVLNSLKAMKPDGRAVLIIDSEMRGQAKRLKHYSMGQNKRFFELLYKHYNVTKHFTVGRTLYRKQGADVPVDVIVIEGRGTSQRPLPEKHVPRIYKSFEELETLVTRATTHTMSQPIASIEDATTHLQKGKKLLTEDGYLSISSNDGGNTFFLEAPMRTQLGGRYFLDYDLLKALEQGFHSQGQKMLSTIPKERLGAVLKVLSNKKVSLVVSENSQAQDTHWPALPTEATTSLKALRNWYSKIKDVALNRELAGFVVVNTARHLLEVGGVKPDTEGNRSLEGRRYRIDETPSSIIISAKGRGEIVSLKDGKLHTNLLTKDVARFSLISEKLGNVLQKREQNKRINSPMSQQLSLR